MLRVLSIQSDILGNKTYGNVLRECFASIDDIQFDSFWYKQDRSLPTRVIHKLASLSLPVLGSGSKNLDLRRARTEWSYGRMSRILTERKLREHHYDVLHFHTQVQAFGSLALMEKIPTVITTDMTVHQASREVVVPHPGTFRMNMHMERRVLQRAAHFVTWSEWARRSALEDIGMPGTKVTAIPPGARFKTFREPIFEERQIPRILFVGGDFKRKGGWDLVDVFSRNFSDRAELHLVTNEPIPRPSKNVFAHAGVTAYTDQWHSLFQSSDVFALPSHADAFGLVLQEAAGYGLALIGSRVGGIPELVTDGQNGYLMEAGNKEELAGCLERLLANKEKLLQMRRTSREIALQRFDADKNAERLADVFRDAAGVHTKSRLRD